MRFPRGIRGEFRAHCIKFSRNGKREPPRSWAVREVAAGDSGYHCSQSVCSLFQEAMRINDRLCGFPRRQTVDELHHARFVRITHGRFATWLNPFGMLDPKVVVNLVPELRVGVDLTRRCRWLGRRLTWLARWFVYFASSVSLPRSETNEFHKCLSIRG